MTKKVMRWARAGAGVALLLGIASVWMVSTHATPAKTDEAAEAADSVGIFQSVDRQYSLKLENQIWCEIFIGNFVYVLHCTIVVDDHFFRSIFRCAPLT